MESFSGVPGRKCVVSVLRESQRNQGKCIQRSCFFSMEKSIKSKVLVTINKEISKTQVKMPKTQQNGQKPQRIFPKTQGTGGINHL